MAPRYTRRSMLAATASAVLAPAAGAFADAMPSAPSRGLRAFDVVVGEFRQCTIHAPDVATALAEAESYRQAGDDLCVWEGSRIVGVLTDRPAPSGVMRLGRVGYKVELHSGPVPPDHIGRVSFPSTCGGTFTISDTRPVETLELLERFCNGDRTPATMDAVLETLRAR